MRMKKAGVVVEEHREGGKPYKIWQADLWECPTCGHECILGFAAKPSAQHFEDHYGVEQKTVTHHIY